MDKDYTCFFTGHRFMSKNAVPLVKERLLREIEALVSDKGVTDFIAGGALGFDTLAAQAVTEMKERYGYIRLHLYLPCYNQMQSWSARDRFEGRMIMSAADEIVYITEGNYVTGCMQLRNKRMAGDAKYCLAYMINSRSGTASTLSYARQNECVIINLADAAD